MAKGKALVIGSNATRIEVQGGGWGPTGNYLNETVVPVMAVIDAGYEVVLATPNGTKPHIDAASDSPVHFWRRPGRLCACEVLLDQRSCDEPGSHAALGD
jgi:hypothetical protein